MDTLTPSDTADRLAGTGFTHEGDMLRGSYETGDFATAAAIVAKVSDLAEAMNHHPDIRLSYGKVEFELTSHDAGGVTERDLDLATRIQAVADEFGATAEQDQ